MAGQRLCGGEGRKARKESKEELRFVRKGVNYPVKEEDEVKEKERRRERVHPCKYRANN